MSYAAQTTDGRSTPDLGRFGSRPEAIYWSVAITMAAAFALTLLLLAVDARTIDGHISAWAKPLKFEASLAIHAATLALVTGLLSPPHRQGSAMLIVAFAFLAASTVEMGWIIWQGARAEQSHFNVSTPFHRLMWSAMAFCAVVIIGAAAAIGLAALRDRSFAASPAVRASIVLGLVGGTILTLITAFAIGGRMSPYVGGVPAVEARMVLTGWSRSGGDLRVSHFLATHMVQALPLFGWLAERIVPGRSALLAVLAFAAAWTGLTLMEFRTALGGAASIFARSMP
ncbi:hypothetical protein [Bradyrhizobium roseum]|uniref:hypothetical protein n=1 Tax=Bradyrhizobium roseum TaxID=3056648 RepID=UPI0026355CA0|nr:hypothetical protein [Bradyrhizobium roseus]WKA31435.1 hypothetical protein QUH67_15280 [Bradyrhizobium roseus]